MATNNQRQPVATVELRPDMLDPIEPDDDPHSRYLGTTAASSADGPFMTIEMEGRQYVLLLDPLCK